MAGIKQISNAELISDIVRVAKLLNKDSLTAVEYEKHGKNSRHTQSLRFGSWNKAVERAGLNVIPQISNTILIDDLKRVARLLESRYVSLDAYIKHGQYSGTVFYKRFGSWIAALKNSGLEMPKRYGPRSLRDVVLATYSIEELVAALDVLYPCNLKSLYNHAEHLLFRKYIINAQNVESIANADNLIRRALAKIMIFYGQKPKKSYLFNPEHSRYRKIDFFLHSNKLINLLKANQIIYVWQFQETAPSDLHLSGSDLYAICAYLVRKGVKLPAHYSETLKRLSPSGKGHVCRGSGYDGIVYAAIGCQEGRINYEKLKDVLASFTPRERLMMEERFFNNKTYEQIRDIFKITREAVRQVIASILRRIVHPKQLNRFFIKNDK